MPQASLKVGYSLQLRQNIALDALADGAAVHADLSQHGDVDDLFSAQIFAGDDLVLTAQAGAIDETINAIRIERGKRQDSGAHCRHLLILQEGWFLPASWCGALQGSP